jgi:hypothetical protein
VTDEQVARWQAKLDREFPYGLLAYFEERNHANYHVPRVVVTGMAGLDPVVWFPVYSGSHKVFGPLQVLSYEQFRSAPRAVRVRFDTIDQTMVWSGSLQPEMVRLMEKDRQDSITAVPHGGDTVIRGEPDK